MPGVWIKLHDIRVRVDRENSDFWNVAECLARLFDVPSFPEPEQSSLEPLEPID